METFVKTFVAEWYFEYNGDLTEARMLLHELRQNAIDMSCENVSELILLHGEYALPSHLGEEDSYLLDDSDSFNWLKLRVRNFGELNFDSNNCLVDDTMDNHINGNIKYGVDAPVEHIVHFSVQQFENCRRMDVYLAKYSKTIEIDNDIIDTKLGDKWHGVLICSHEDTEKPYVSCVTKMLDFISKKNIEVKSDEDK